jgi:hypothetical protein
MSVWGNVPSYFGGIALILTVVILMRDRRERIRSQADHIAAWVQRSQDPKEAHRVVIKNASNLPCTRVTVWFTEGYRSPTKLRLSKTFGADTDRQRKPRYLHAVGPDETGVVYETLEDIAIRGVEFTDAAGRRWTRVDDKLKRTRRVRLARTRRLMSRLHTRIRRRRKRANS